jgi:trk system potassium uptake protein TrkA
MITTTDKDEKNLVIASIAKSLGARRAIARITDPEHTDQIEMLKSTFGIDHIVNPDLSIAVEINKYLVEKYTLDNGIFYAGKIAMIEFRARLIEDLVGSSIRQLEQKLGSVRLAAFSRNGKMIIPRVSDPFIMEEDDDLYVIGEKTLIEGISKKVFERGKYTDVQRVMIAGGGKTGYYLARMLEDFGATVKIIEMSKKRCQYLSSRLEKTLVLHGDATDVNLLHDENFDELDSFVSCTGMDEENLLLALMAKKANIEDVIAKVSRENYSSLIEDMGVDMALSPVNITAGHIHRMMQSARIVSSQVLQGQAELNVILIEDDMMLSDRPLSYIKVSDGLLKIAAIQRGGSVIIPDSETRVKGGDRLIVVCQLSDTLDLEKLLKPRKGLIGR